jgi:hypothetical protein
MYLIIEGARSKSGASPPGTFKAVEKIDVFIYLSLK